MIGEDGGCVIGSVGLIWEKRGHYGIAKVMLVVCVVISSCHPHNNVTAKELELKSLTCIPIASHITRLPQK